ncbi:MAG: T9SS type A sorting domain-containing protein [Minisyncoccia bacterium]
MKKLYTLLSLSFIIIGLGLNAQNSWSPKAQFGGTGRSGAVAFSIGEKGYIGTGTDGSAKQDFWEWDANTNVWTQKANFGGTARFGAVGFSINSKGYIGTGTDGGYFYQDFWEWDQSTNIWTQKANFSGGIRKEAVGFSIGDKGYIGTGKKSSMTYGKDFYEYDPSTDSWTQKADFGGTARNGAVGFFIKNKGYIGTGHDVSGLFQKDFWEYDPTTDSWTQKTNFGGTERYLAVGFSIGNKGYIGTGWSFNAYKQDFWEYNSSSDVWIQKTNYLSNVQSPVGFATCTKGYIGTGSDNSNSYKSFAEYTPSIPIAAAFTPSQTSFCEAGCINFTDNSTCAPTSWNWTFPGGTPSSSSVQNPNNVCFNNAGTYTVTLIASTGNCSFTATQVITVNSLPIITVTGIDTICIGNNTALTASGATNYSWSPTTGLSNANISNPVASPIINTTYTVSGTNSNGCINTTTESITVNALPIIIASGTNTICFGDSATISASAAITYSWAPGGQTDSNNSVSPITTTTYTVTGTDANSCANTATVAITVNQPPNLSLSSNSPQCPGSNLNLSSNLVSGASYSWTGPNSFSSAYQNPLTIIATVADSGYYYCTITGTNGCSWMDSLLVIVSTTPHATVTASGSTTFCQGDSVILTATAGNSYVWSTSDTIQAITVTSAGNYSCTVTSPNGCIGDATTTAVNVAINPLPSVPAITQNGFTLSSSVSGTTYKWYMNGILQTSYTTQFITITSAENGSWWVVITNSFGCSSTSPWFNSTVGINEMMNVSGITISPNPFTSQTIISFKQEQKNTIVKIADVLGKEIKSIIFSGKELIIEKGEMPVGIYFLEITDENKNVINRKIVVQ